MNVQELKIKLDKLGISEDSYSLYGGVDILKAILEWGIKWRITILTREETTII
jgi:hypothetical protein